MKKNPITDIEILCDTFISSIHEFCMTHDIEQDVTSCCGEVEDTMDNVRSELMDREEDDVS